VGEQHDRVVTVLPQVPLHRRADPLLGAVDHAPPNPCGRPEIDDLHVETASRKTELEDAAEVAAALRVVGPPAGEALDGRQSVVDRLRCPLLRCRCRDPNPVQDVHHLDLP